MKVQNIGDKEKIPKTGDKEKILQRGKHRLHLKVEESEWLWTSQQLPRKIEENGVKPFKFWGKYPA